jgi:hypothetical protein
MSTLLAGILELKISMIILSIKDGFEKVQKAVTPAKAGVQKYLNFLDSRFRGNDKKGKESFIQDE